MKRYLNITVIPTIYERIKILFTGRIDIEGFMSDNGNIKSSNLKVTYRRK